MARFAVRVGDYHVGVQTDSAGVADVLRRRLEGSLVDDPEVPGNLSIYEGEPRSGGARPMLRVYEGCTHLFTTPTRTRAVQVAIARMDGFVPPEARRTGDVLVLRMAAVHDRGRALLVPSALLGREPALERRLRHDRLEVHPGPLVAIDPSGELVLPPPWPVAARHAGARPAEHRLNVFGWLVDSYNELGRPVTRALAVARALTRTAEPPGTREFERVAALLARTELIVDTDGAPVAAIRSAFRAGPRGC